MRTLYKYLVRLHPPAFRREFAAEMLWIFDEAAESEGALSLCFDGFVSLARQWVLRSGSWKLAVAGMGACVQITAGGLIFLLLGQARGGAELQTHHASGVALSGLMRLIVWLVGAIVLMVIGASLWVRSFIARRMERAPGRYSLT
jgi:hypothetical protein